jgi:hypothetical protein
MVYMSDNRTQKAKDQEWLREVVRKALFIHDDYGNDVEGIFCYINQGSGGMMVNATPSFQLSCALKLIRSFQNQTGVPTSNIVEFIEDNLSEA